MPTADEKAREALEQAFVAVANLVIEAYHQKRPLEQVTATHGWTNAAINEAVRLAWEAGCLSAYHLPVSSPPPWLPKPPKDGPLHRHGGSSCRGESCLRDAQEEDEPRGEEEGA